MKTLKRKIALMLTLCMVLTSITPAYADVETVLEAAAFDTVILEEDENVGIVEEASPAEAAYDFATPSDAEYAETEEPEELLPEEIIPEKATPSNAKREGEILIREITVNGIKITLTADPGVFPEDAELWAERVEDEAAEEAIEEAVEKERDSRVNVASSIKFDIKMLLLGEEIQPDTTKGSVKVTFTLEEKLNDCLTANAYHLKEEADGELTAENLEAEVKTVEAGVTESSEEAALLEEDEILSDGIIEDDAALNAEVTEIEAEITGFSYYVVEFTYNELQYVLPGDSSVKLSEILKTFSIEGTISEAEVSNTELFTVTEDEDGDDWTVTPLRAFSSKEWLKVTIDDQVYEITVTDDQNGQEPVEYLDWDDTQKKLVKKTCTDYTVIDSTTEEPADGYILEYDKWYVVKGNVTLKKRIVAKAWTSIGVIPSTHLILTDGSFLNAEKGILVKPSGFITIYGQENGSGSLTANADYAFPGIGGTDDNISSGFIVINGGTVTATGGTRAPGIDGYRKLVINGGTVTATGGSFAPGIGGRYGKHEKGTTAGDITINGGTVTAIGGGGALGIGYGHDCPSKSGTININGGTVTAHGGLGAENITINEDMLIYAGRSREYAVRSDKSGIGSKYVLIDTGVNYYVSHMKQSVDDPTVYVLEDKDSLHGSVGFKTDAAAKDYPGFSAQDITQKEISADGGTTVQIKYSRNTYTIRFDTRGICEGPESIQAIYGSTVLVNTGTLSALGYDFDKWYKDSECTEEFSVPQNVEIPDHDITIYAGWIPKTDTPYKVYHYYQNSDGTEYLPPEIQNMTGTSGEYSVAEKQDRTGFVALSFKQERIAGDGSTVIKIYYDRIRYTISFDTNGHGTAPDPITALPGTEIIQPQDPYTEGYTFGGWFTDAKCTNQFTFSTMPSEDKTLFAKWTPIPYTITWKDGNTVLRTDKVDYDAMPDYGPDPSKTGYEFLLWWPTIQKVTGDATYNAIFFKPTVKCTVTWMLNDIKLIDTTEVTEGEMPVHENPEREGYIFIGWQPALAPVTGNVKYTAYFEERGTDKVAVTFNTDGGTFINTQVIDRNTTPVKPSDPQKKGYKFEGWYREAGFITPYNFDEPVNTDMILYAKWTELPVTVYTVTWKLDDETLIDTTEVKEGDMPSHSSPAKEGYIFVGWDPALQPVTSNITYTAKFEQRTPEKAAVTFNTGGGSFIETQVVTTGQKAVRPADPVKTGYSFVNWYADAAFTTAYDFNASVNADITLFAKWQKNAGKEYTITWKDWNGNVLASQKVSEGGLPDYPGTSNPSRSGYIFTGWTPKIGLAYADQTYTATYSPQTVINGGGGGSGAPAAKKTAVTFSPNWYADAFGVWRIKNSAGQVVTNAWLCDDAVTANGQNVWYLLTQDGAMLAAGLVQDATGNFYSLETNHDGYFGMLRYTDGYYNCNGQQVYLKFSHEHNGTFGAVVNPEGIEKLKAIYGVTKYGIGNENAVYTKSF